MGNIEKNMIYIDKNVDFEVKWTWKSWVILAIVIAFLGALVWISFGNTASAETWTITAFTKNDQTGTFIEDVWPGVTRTTIAATNYSQVTIEYPDGKTLAWFPADACHAFKNSSSCQHQYIPSFYEIDQYSNVTVKLECQWCGGKVYSHIEDVQVCLLEDLGISTLTIKNDAPKPKPVEVKQKDNGGKVKKTEPSEEPIEDPTEEPVEEPIPAITYRYEDKDRNSHIKYTFENGYLINEETEYHSIKPDHTTGYGDDFYCEMMMVCDLCGHEHEMTNGWAHNDTNGDGVCDNCGSTNCDWEFIQYWYEH